VFQVPQRLRLVLEEAVQQQVQVGGSELSVVVVRGDLPQLRHDRPDHVPLQLLHWLEGTRLFGSYVCGQRHPVRTREKVSWSQSV